MARFETISGEAVDPQLVATKADNGLMSATDKSKLDGIASGANNYTHPSTHAASMITQDATHRFVSDTEKSTWNSKAAGNHTHDLSGLINNLSTGDATPTDADYFISQYVGGGTTTTTYHRRPVSTIWSYIKSKADSTYQAKGTYASTAAASTSANGLMTAAMVTKLNGIATGANAYTHPSYTARSAGLYKITVDASGHVSAVTAVAKSDITGLGIPAQDTTYSDMKAATSSAAGTHGLVPAPAAGKQGAFLRGDGTWQTPTNTTYGDMTAATASAAGTHGLVPAPAAGKQASFLRGDGTWQVPTNTTYSDATTSSHGLMTAAMVTKLNGIATNANAYSHPSYTARSAGLYKITVDASGHVSAATAVAKSDITALGIPSTNTTYSNMGAATSSAAGSAGLVPAPAAGKQTSFLRGDGTWVVPTNTTYSTMTAATSSAAGSTGLVPAPGAGKQTSFLRGDGTWVVPTNTTYGVASTSANGLMSSTDKSKLDGIASGANKYTHPSYTAQSSGLYKITVDASGHVSAATAVAKSDITALGIPASDTNTWRGIQNNLTSTSTTDSLSAAQGKALKDALDSLTTTVNALNTWKTNVLNGSTAVLVSV